MEGIGIGIGRAALDLATRYANERVVFDRPIGKNQAVAHSLADAWMRLEAAELMAMKAAKLYETWLEWSRNAWIASAGLTRWCADGRYMAVGALEPDFYREFISRLGVDLAGWPDQDDRAAWPRLRQLIASAVAASRPRSTGPRWPPPCRPGSEPRGHDAMSTGAVVIATA